MIRGLSVGVVAIVVVLDVGIGRCCGDLAVVIVIDVEIRRAVGSWEARPDLLAINHAWLALVSHKHCNDAWLRTLFVHPHSSCLPRCLPT